MIYERCRRHTYVRMPFSPPMVFACAPQNGFEYGCGITSPVCLLGNDRFVLEAFICLLTSLTHRKEKGKRPRWKAISFLCVCVCVCVCGSSRRRAEGIFCGWRDAIWFDRKESRCSETYSIQLERGVTTSWLRDFLRYSQYRLKEGDRCWLTSFLSLRNELAASAGSFVPVWNYKTWFLIKFFFSFTFDYFFFICLFNAQINFKRHLPIIDQIYSTWLQFWIECGKWWDKFLKKCRLATLYKRNFDLTYSWAASLQASSSTKCWDWSHFSAFFATNIQEVCSWARARDM